MEKYRPSISLKPRKVNQIGEVYFLFSERLLTPDRFNLTLANISNDFWFDLSYLTNVIENPPQMLDWKVYDFTETKIGFKMNFSDPLYVSSAEKIDTIQLSLLQPQIFQSALDGFTIQEVQNYTLEVAQQALSEESFHQMQYQADAATNTMWIIFCLSIFFKLIKGQIDEDALYAMLSFAQLLI